MNKKATFFISILLILSAIIIQLLNNFSENVIVELVEFVTGLLFGAGLVLIIQIIFKKKQV